MAKSCEGEIEPKFFCGKIPKCKTDGYKWQKATTAHFNRYQPVIILAMDTYPKGVYIVEFKGDHGNHLVKVFK